jgi:hypothetical protein
MGAKLTKSKSLLFSRKTKEEQKEIITTIGNTNNHLETTTNEDNKQIEKKNKKKKEPKLNKKSSKTTVDKSTNTENCVLPSSSSTEQLVGDQVSAVNNNVSLDINTAQINAAYQSELANQDGQELQDTCFQNGIISTEPHSGSQQTSSEHKHQANTLNITEDATNNASVTLVTNNDQVHDKEQQSVES